MPASRPEFRGLDEGKPVRIYQRNLPHWRQDGATYFVTFRLADSIPRGVIEKWEHARQTWFRAHGMDMISKKDSPEVFAAHYNRIPETERRQFEKQQARQLHLELDNCHGCCVLRLDSVAKILANVIKHFDGDRWHLGDFVIMPNHVHLLAEPCPTFDLEDILGSIKKFASRQINLWAIENNLDSTLPKRSLWQQESYDRIVRDAEELAAYRNYIGINPQKAKLREREFIHHKADWLDEWTTPRIG